MRRSTCGKKNGVWGARSSPLAMSQYDRLCKPPEPMANISRGSDAISQGGRRRKSWPQPVNIAFTTASGDCRLRPAAAERSSFGNVIFGWAVRLYVSKQKTRAKSITASLGSWQHSESQGRTGLMTGVPAGNGGQPRNELFGFS